MAGYCVCVCVCVHDNCSHERDSCEFFSCSVRKKITPTPLFMYFVYVGLPSHSRNTTVTGDGGDGAGVQGEQSEEKEEEDRSSDTATSESDSEDGDKSITMAQRFQDYHMSEGKGKLRYQAFTNVESKIMACKDTKMLQEWKRDKDYPPAFDDVINSRIQALVGGSSSSSNSSDISSGAGGGGGGDGAGIGGTGVGVDCGDGDVKSLSGS